MIQKIRKRDGSLANFTPEKITNAIEKAINAVGERDGKLARQLSSQVVRAVEKKFVDRIPSVEDVQDLVEETLIKNGYAKVAKAYILFRERRAEIRDIKKFFGVEDELKLPLPATRILEKRYLLKDQNGNVIETSSQMFLRVSRAVAQADLLYDPSANLVKISSKFYKVMSSLEFLPNSPTLMNAGTDLGQLSACFVLPVEDSIRGIFQSLEWMALIHQSGGGTGFSFSRLRPRGDTVKSTGGIASGPISFMQIFDSSTEVIKQGGRRRGANMGVLRMDHPDILEFIMAKEKKEFLTNFNLSVAVTDEFMKAVEEDGEYELINPRTGVPTRKIKARFVFNQIVTMAWRTGDPGLLFIDEINRRNPTPHLGPIESTNPCGEQPLLPFESCNLGSINLARMVSKNEIDWEKLGSTIDVAVHFLDNVIDVNKYPLPEIEKITKSNRKIGLGVMGFADMLIRLGIQYDSKEGISTAESLMKFITSEVRKKSVELAEQRGSFPNFAGSRWEKEGYKAIRNASLLTIAPTGTISIIAGCSSGIEPLFAVAFIRNVMEGTRFLEVNPLFESMAKEMGFYSKDLFIKIAKKGSLQEIDVPEKIKKLFVTAHDISPEWHVRMQAAFQKYVDNAVSKTVNFPHDATVEDVERVFLLAYKLKCKGITIYRYGSKPEQTLYIGSVLGKERGETLEYTSAELEYSGGCPVSYCGF